MARFRLTGLSIFSVSLQWERRDDDREIARRLFNMLEDRRMLWKDFDLEIEEHCVKSANFAREQLIQLLNNPEIGAELEWRVKAIQAAFRSFVDGVGDADDEDYYHYRHRGRGTDRLSVALGRLRGLVGVQLGEIASIWDVEVGDDLASIVPDGAGWFFERFDA